MFDKITRRADCANKRRIYKYSGIVCEIGVRDCLFLEKTEHIYHIDSFKLFFDCLFFWTKIFFINFTILFFWTKIFFINFIILFFWTKIFFINFTILFFWTKIFFINFIILFFWTKIFFINFTILCCANKRKIYKYSGIVCERIR